LRFGINFLQSTCFWPNDSQKGDNMSFVMRTLSGAKGAARRTIVRSRTVGRRRG